MVAEETSIEEYIAALKTRSVADRLRVIAAISSGLVEGEETFAKEPSLAYGGGNKKPLDTESIIDVEPEEESSNVIELSAYKNTKTSDGWKSLWGVWEDSTPENLHELIRADRGPEKEPPNFDL